MVIQLNESISDFSTRMHGMVQTISEENASVSQRVHGLLGERVTEAESLEPS